MARKSRNSWMTVLAFVFLAPVFLYGADYFVQKSRDHRTAEDTEVHRVQGNPYIHLGDRVPVTEVPLGSVFYVHNRYIKTETCHVNVSNVYWNLETGVVHHYSMFVNWFKAGEFTADEVFIANDFLPAGRYQIIKKSVHTCNGREHYTLNFNIPINFVSKKK